MECMDSGAKAKDMRLTGELFHNNRTPLSAHPEAHLCFLRIPRC